MTAVDPKNLNGPWTLYLEGVRVKHSQMSVSGVSGGYATAVVGLPFDRAEQKIKKIRPNTRCEIFFGEDMFLLFDGELVEKRFERKHGSPTALFVCHGVMGNVARSRYANINPSTTGSPAANAYMAGTGDVTVLSGTAGDAVVFTGTTLGSQASEGSGHPEGYLASTIVKNMIADRFVEGLGSGPFDMAAGFREILSAFIYADEIPDGVRGSGLFVNGDVVASYLGTLDYRYRLIDSLQGATLQEFISIFYGVPSKDETAINPFVAAILNECVNGEFSVVEVLRLLANRAFHSMSEMIAPPMLKNKEGKLVLGRMMMTPRLYHADPPVCNFFLPQMVAGIGHNVSALKTTRLIASQFMPATSDPMINVMGISPLELEAKVIVGKGASRRLSTASAITQEEADVGALSQVQQNIFGAAWGFGDEYMATIAKWFAKTEPLRFYAARTEGQKQEITMDFNPFVAVDFPGLSYDPELGIGRGLVTSLTHNINASGASTAIGMQYCVFPEDACEFLHAELDPETGMGGNSALGIYKNGAAEDLYQANLGCPSLANAIRQTSKTSGIDGSKSLADMAKATYDKFAAIESPFSEKRAIHTFIKRNIANLDDLIEFYRKPGSPTEKRKPGIPSILPLDGVYAAASAGITLTVNDPAGGPPKVVKYVLGPGDVRETEQQILDRRIPVLEYVKAIGA